jgi:hypothetical protein
MTKRASAAVTASPTTPGGPSPDAGRGYPRVPQTPTGLRIRQSRSCPAATESAARCKCTPAVEARTFDKRSGKKIRKTFTGPGAVGEAKGWRAAATGAVRRGTLKPRRATSLREVAEAWLEGAKTGEDRRDPQPFRRSLQAQRHLLLRTVA